MPALILPHHGVAPRIAAGVFLAANATIIGDVEIAAGASIWFGCVLRGDTNRIRIGADTNVQDGTIIHVNRDRGADEAPPAGTAATIGQRVTIGHMALIHACTIADDAFIGMKACIMDGAYVESGAMVAAGALVTPGKRVKSGELWAGNPAKFMRALTTAEIAYFAKSAHHYRQLAESYGVNV